MTPEEIAHIIYEHQHSSDFGDRAAEQIFALIAQAIRQAENDKLEEAARAADDAQAEADSCSSRVVEEEIIAAAVSESCGIVASAIRALKKD